jgi:hypothetical protein
MNTVTDNQAYQLSNINESYKELKNKFQEFVESAEKFVEKDEQIENKFIFDKVDDKNYFNISFIDKIVQFKFISLYNESQELNGTIIVNSICLQTNQIIKELGRFNFDTSGITDIEIEGKIEKLNIKSQVAFYIIQFYILESIKAQ